jgi:DNA-binding IclR family transcriptional regulator
MDKPRGTQSIQKAIKLLDLIANNPSGLTLPEICVKANFPKSTVYRILSALLDQDLIRFSPETTV